jgi:hypothetical protein
MMTMPKPGGGRYPGISWEAKCASGLSGIRYEGGAILIQAHVRNVGAWALMPREKLKRKNRESLSPDAVPRDGVTRSSDEAP